MGGFEPPIAFLRTGDRTKDGRPAVQVDKTVRRATELWLASWRFCAGLRGRKA